MKTTTIFCMALALMILPSAPAQPVIAPHPGPHPVPGHEGEVYVYGHRVPAGSPVLGQNFTMPALSVAPMMAAGVRPGDSYLGIHIVEVEDQRAGELEMDSPHGVEISNVAEESPAAEGGLQKGDVVVELDGQRVRGVEHFVRLVRETPAGRTIAMSIVRDGEPMDLTAKVGRRKAAHQKRHFVFCDGDDEDCTSALPNADFFRKQVRGIRRQITHMDIPRPRVAMQNRYLGAELESVEGQLADYFGVVEGVLVRSIDADQPGKRAGLQAGDVITSVDGKAVDSPSELREKVMRADPNKKVRLAVMRKGSARKLMLEPRQSEEPPEERGAKARPVREKRTKP